MGRDPPRDSHPDGNSHYRSGEHQRAWRALCVWAAGRVLIDVRLDGCHTLAPELVRGDGRILPAPVYPSPVGDAVRRVLGQERLNRLMEFRSTIRRQTQPLTRPFHQAWPTITYYLGFITTFLVVIAWVTNLFSKPEATIFGGTVTIIGVAIAAWHFRYQSARRPVVFLDPVQFVPNSRLVLLSPLGEHNRQVITAAVEGADDATLVFLYLAPPRPQEAPPRLFEIRDRYGLDKVGKDILSIAKRTAMRANVPAKYLYAIGGPQQVFDIAGQVRPEEIIAEATVSKEVTQAARSNSRLMIAPEYVRFQLIDGVKIAHNVMHDIYLQHAHGTRPNGVEAPFRRQGSPLRAPVPAPPLATPNAAPPPTSERADTANEAGPARVTDPVDPPPETQ